MSTQEDITIAKVVLAGWQLVDASGEHYATYHVLDPVGNIRAARSTRYSAALAAERIMETGVTEWGT